MPASAEGLHGERHLSDHGSVATRGYGPPDGTLPRGLVGHVREGSSPPDLGAEVCAQPSLRTAAGRAVSATERSTLDDVEDQGPCGDGGEIGAGLLCFERDAVGGAGFAQCCKGMVPFGRLCW